TLCLGLGPSGTLSAALNGPTILFVFSQTLCLAWDPRGPAPRLSMARRYSSCSPRPSVWPGTLVDPLRGSQWPDDTLRVLPDPLFGLGPSGTLSAALNGPTILFVFSQTLCLAWDPRGPSPRLSMARRYSSCSPRPSVWPGTLGDPLRGSQWPDDTLRVLPDPLFGLGPSGTLSAALNGPTILFVFSQTLCLAWDPRGPSPRLSMARRYSSCSPRPSVWPGTLGDPLRGSQWPDDTLRVLPDPLFGQGRSWTLSAALNGPTILVVFSQIPLFGLGPSGTLSAALNGPTILFVLSQTLCLAWDPRGPSPRLSMARRYSSCSPRPSVWPGTLVDPLRGYQWPDDTRRVLPDPLFGLGPSGTLSAALNRPDDTLRALPDPLFGLGPSGTLSAALNGPTILFVFSQTLCLARDARGPSPRLSMARRYSSCSPRSSVWPGTLGDPLRGSQWPDDTLRALPDPLFGLGPSGTLSAALNGPTILFVFSQTLCLAWDPRGPSPRLSIARRYSSCSPRPSVWPGTLGDPLRGYQWPDDTRRVLPDPLFGLGPSWTISAAINGPTILFVFSQTLCLAWDPRGPSPRLSIGPTILFVLLPDPLFGLGPSGTLSAALNRPDDTLRALPDPLFGLGPSGTLSAALNGPTILFVFSQDPLFGLGPSGTLSAALNSPTILFVLSQTLCLAWDPRGPSPRLSIGPTILVVFSQILCLAWDPRGPSPRLSMARRYSSCSPRSSVWPGTLGDPLRGSQWPDDTLRVLPDPLFGLGPSGTLSAALNGPTILFVSIDEGSQVWLQLAVALSTPPTSWQPPRDEANRDGAALVVHRK
ncbi:hypothetical protein MTO96_032133, partial [Rhipicephalus appendiculatus]